MTDLRSLLDASRIDVSSFRLDQGSLPLGLLTTTGDRAIPLWRALRPLFGTTGHWPVVVGTDDALDAIQHQMKSQPKSTPRIPHLNEARETLSQARAEENVIRRAELPLALRAFFATATSAGELVNRLRPATGTPPESYSIPYEDMHLTRPLARVHLALVPVESQWQVPAFLGLGDWNDCPAPEVHAAILRDWGDRFGAEVVGLSNDTLELRVARPPRRRSAARALAREQYLYCQDIVDQGIRSIEALAIALLRAPSWYFWWD